jgi:hypothetical protein
MPAEQLGIKERAVLLVLMAEAREVSNPELKQIAGFDLTGAARRKLNARRLVDSRRAGRAYVHLLTDDGWAWCAAKLAAPPPERAGSAGGALYAVLAGLHRYLARADLRLSDVFRPEGTPAPSAVPAPPAPAPAPASSSLNLPELIRTAYRKLARDAGDLVSLTELRPLLGGVPREEVDEALRRLSRDRIAHLVPQANQKVLSQADRAAAVRIGAEDCHQLSIGES